MFKTSWHEKKAKGGERGWLNDPWYYREDTTRETRRRKEKHQEKMYVEEGEGFSAIMQDQDIWQPQ